MDTETTVRTIYALIGAGTAFAAVVAFVYNTRGIATNADHRSRNLDQWRALLPSQLDSTYARKDVLAVELKAIRESLERVEARQQRGGMGV